MEKYAIYTYRLTPAETQSSIYFESERSPIEKLSLRERFESLFGERPGASVSIKKEKRDKTADHYPCKVLRHENNVILLRLEHPKDVNIWDKEHSEKPIPRIEKRQQPSNPYSYVFIDNREGYQQIAIQSGTAAWKNANEVRNLLMESFNWLLLYNDYGVKINIMSKMKPSRFWDYVDMKRKKEKVHIKSLTFSFANNIRRPDIDIRSALSSEWRRFDSLVTLLDKIGGDRGEITITSSGNDELMKRRFADVKHMVEICANSNYGLSITFSDNETYKCNQELRAEFPMEENIRMDYEKGVHDLFGFYKINVWLSDIAKKIEQYKDVEEIKPKPTNKSQQKVS